MMLLKKSLLGVVAALGLMQGALAANPDLQGVWWNEKPVKTLVPSNMKAIPFTAEGKKLYAESMAQLKAEEGKPIAREDVRRCLPFGPTRILQQPFPLQIIQKGDFFAIVYEHNHVHEIVYLNEKPDPDRDWAFMGNSTAEWTKDGIAISTIGFKDQIMLDDSGLPHSDQLSIKRVMRKINDGKQLEIVTTITDPVVFSKPWSVRDVLEAKPKERIEEYTCGQGTLETRYTRK